MLIILLGLVAHYQGRSDIALMLIREAICLAPDVARLTNLEIRCY